MKRRPAERSGSGRVAQSRRVSAVGMDSKSAPEVEVEAEPKPEFPHASTCVELTRDFGPDYWRDFCVRGDASGYVQEYAAFAKSGYTVRALLQISKEALQYVGDTVAARAKDHVIGDHEFRNLTRVILHDDVEVMRRFFPYQLPRHDRLALLFEGLCQAGAIRLIKAWGTVAYFKLPKDRRRQGLVEAVEYGHMGLFRYLREIDPDLKVDTLRLLNCAMRGNAAPGSLSCVMHHLRSLPHAAAEASSLLGLLFSGSTKFPPTSRVVSALGTLGCIPWGAVSIQHIGLALTCTDVAPADASDFFRQWSDLLDQERSLRKREEWLALGLAYKRAHRLVPTRRDQLRLLACVDDKTAEERVLMETELGVRLRVDPVE